MIRPLGRCWRGCNIDGMELNDKTTRCGGCGAVVPIISVQVPKSTEDSNGKKLRPEDWNRIVDCPKCGVRGTKGNPPRFAILITHFRASRRSFFRGCVLGVPTLLLQLR